MQHPGGWQRCTEEPGIAMHDVHHCEQWTANKKRERYNMDIYLIRHGKTKGNLEGRYIGTTDEPLCEEGKQSLMQMADAKKYPAVEALFVSPMLRCRESAKILFPKQSISVVSDLRECDFGRYENKNFQELSGDADYQRWLDSNGTLPFPAGEEQSHFRKRCVKAFKTIVAELLEQKKYSAAIVVHGGTIMSILEALAEEKKAFYDWQVGNAMGYHLYISDETWKKRQRLTVLEKIT